MFTLKFYRTIDDDNSLIRCISAPHYEAHKREHFYTITIYKDFYSLDGVEYQINHHEGSYDVCYVENERGKTIEKYVPSAPKNQVIADD